MQMKNDSEREVGPALGMRYRTGVLAHARQHYHEAGWDFIVESLSTSELAEVIGPAESLEEAIALAAVRANELDRARKERASR